MIETVFVWLALAGREAEVQQLLRRADAAMRRTDVAMRNEVLATFVAHNLSGLVMAIYEPGISPAFAPEPDGPRDIIRFPGRVAQ